MHDKDPSELLAGFKARDRASLVFVYRNYRDKIIAHLMRQQASREDAEDIFQNVIMSLLRQTGSGKLKELSCSFQHFLFVCCERQWFKTFKRQNREKEVTILAAEVLEDDSNPENVLDDVDLRIAVQEALSQMGEPCQTLLTTHYYASVSQKDMAEEADISHPAMRQRINRCRNKLRELVSQHPALKLFLPYEK